MDFHPTDRFQFSYVRGREVIASETSAADLAVVAGADATCAKSRRGVVLARRRSDGYRAFLGHNGPPAHRPCTRDMVCRAACGRLAVHAEQAALLAAGHEAATSEVVHVKVVDGAAVPSGPPSCPECSKLMLAAGVAGVWLLHADGWRRYDAVEFDRLTAEHVRSLPARILR